MNDFKQFEVLDFTTDMLSDGVRYLLPRRQFGHLRYVGWIGVVFGIVLTVFSLGWSSITVLGAWDEIAKGGIGRWMSIAFAGIGLLIFLQGLIVVSCGIAVIRNRTRCEIEVRAGMVRVKERFSLLMPRRTRRVAKIQRLRIVNASESLPGKQNHDTRAWLGDFDTALMAENQDTRRFPIAVAYPHDLLVRLADELAPRLEAEWNLASATIERDPAALAVGELVPRKIEVVEGLVQPGELPPVPFQPTGSTATIERRPYGVTITIPPAGIWKGSKGLIAVSLVWNAFVSIFFVMATLVTVGVIEPVADGPAWIALVILIPLVAVGGGMMIGAINMGRRHASIATADDLLMIVQHSVFGKSTREWSASQIAAICVGNSGMEVNDVPVKELQIHPNDDRKFGCLSQLDDDELIWIAAELNLALALHAPSDPPAL